MIGRFVNTARHYRLDAANRLAVWRSRRREDAWHRIVSGPPRLVSVRTRNGYLTFHSRDSVIGRTLFTEGGWEIELIRRTAELLREHDMLDTARPTLVDAGANIGTTTVAFVRARTFRTAVAVEPEPLNFELLERNVRQNGLSKRVRCVRSALGAAPGEAELEIATDNLGDHRIRTDAGPGAYGETDRPTRPVAVRRLDDVLDQDGDFAGRSVGLLWIDVQGYEGHVLAGAQRLLGLGVPVEMEVWPYGLERAGTSKHALLSTLAVNFRTFINLREGRSRPRPIDALEDLYRALSGPFSDTEILLLP